MLWKAVGMVRTQEMSAVIVLSRITCYISPFPYTT